MSFYYNNTFNYVFLQEEINGTHKTVLFHNRQTNHYIRYWGDIDSNNAFNSEIWCSSNQFSMPVTGQQGYIVVDMGPGNSMDPHRQMLIDGINEWVRLAKQDYRS